MHIMNTIIPAQVSLDSHPASTVNIITHVKVKMDYRLNALKHNESITLCCPMIMIAYY